MEDLLELRYSLLVNLHSSIGTEWSHNIIQINLISRLFMRLNMYLKGIRKVHFIKPSPSLRFYLLSHFSTFSFFIKFIL